MSGFVTVYVTAASPAEAETIARTVVEERLAACANILPGVKSIYRWQDKMTESAEIAIILKTAAGKFDALAARIKQLHSYECPCIVAWPIAAGDADYLKWIADSVK